MVVIVGCIIVMACVLGGFTLAGGHVMALMHPTEVLTIGGAALGALVIMSPMKVLKDLMKGMISTLKGSPVKKESYTQLFKVLYDLMRTARRDGLISLESHLSEPQQSPIFQKYPEILHNHHATDFICGAMQPIIEGTADEAQLTALLDTELRVIEEEHHAPIHALSKTADALPGFGIVAAVLGIVITMGAIDGPVTEIGHKVGAALVGTFLGILASYGFIGPLVGRMESMGHEEMQFFHTIKAAIVGYVKSSQPKVAIDLARRGVATEMRPSRIEMDQMFKDVDATYCDGQLVEKGDWLRSQRK